MPRVLHLQLPLACALLGLLGGCPASPPAAKRTTRPTSATTKTTAVTSKVCVARHAEAYQNLVPRPAGLTAAKLDSLTARGEEQARGAAKLLPSGVSLVMSSPAQRARQTAVLLGRGPAGRAVKVVAALRSLDGALAWGKRLQAFAKGQDPRPLGGESLADGQARVRTLLAGLRKRLVPGRHALLVTHGDIAALLLGELEGVPLLERPRRNKLGTGALRCLPLR